MLLLLLYPPFAFPPATVLIVLEGKEIEFPATAWASRHICAISGAPACGSAVASAFLGGRAGWGDQQLLVRGNYWYEVDGRGDVIALTDATGNTVDRYSYDLWDKLVNSLGSLPLHRPLLRARPAPSRPRSRRQLRGRPARPSPRIR